MFNRQNDETRWNAAYEEIKKSISVLNACGHDLQYQNSPRVNASGWVSLFSQVDGNKEAVFVTLYNTNVSASQVDFSKNNTWENGICPSNATGGGGKTPSAIVYES